MCHQCCIGMNFFIGHFFKGEGNISYHILYYIILYIIQSDFKMYFILLGMSKTKDKKRLPVNDKNINFYLRVPVFSF